MPTILLAQGRYVPELTIRSTSSKGGYDDEIISPFA